MVEIPRIKVGDRQTIETLINEEALLLAKHLKSEKELWVPRLPAMKKIKMAKCACVVGEKLPLFGPTYYCPNIDCESYMALKQGEKCPQCGAEAKPFGMRDGAALFASKKANKKTAAESEKVAGISEKGGYYCPNPKCANVTELRQGEKCPACGTEAQSDDYGEAQPLAKSKEGWDENESKPLFTEATTNEELLKKICLGVEHLNKLEQSTLGRGDVAPAGSSSAQILSLQNKIIILQNEFILRNLNKKGT
jgi:hypothetical protein